MIDPYAGGIGQLLELGIALRQELMQRRVEQADGARQARHFRENLFEVASLSRQQQGERLAAAGLVVCEDHLADRADPIGVEEHVLGAA